ncbi:SWIM-type zinc finger protein [Vibrio phage Va2]|nr:SWIM-type zinc finger protein [Vibrio phage Va2]
MAIGKVKPVKVDKESPAEKARRLNKERAERSKIQSLTIKQLLDSLYKFRKKKNIRSTGVAEILEVRPSKTKVPYLIIHAQVRGTKLWQQRLHFPSVRISEVPAPGFEIPIKDKKGYTFYCPRLTENTTVLLRCSCPDFRFTFMYPDYDKKSLQGRRIPYQRKTTTRPPRNPDDIPGVCKHLIAVFNKLTNLGFIDKLSNSVQVSTPGYLWRK